MNASSALNVSSQSKSASGPPGEAGSPPRIQTGSSHEVGEEWRDQATRELLDAVVALPDRASAERFFREHDELREFLRTRSRHNQHVPASRRRSRFLRNAGIALKALQTA